MCTSPRLRKATLVLSAFVAVVLFASPAFASGAKLELIPELPVMVTLVVAFGVLIVPLDRLLFRPLLAVFDEREAKVDGARQKAAVLSKEAETSLIRYETSLKTSREEIAQECKALLRDAREREEKMVRAERQRAEQELGTARAALEASVGQVRAELRQSVQALGREAAEKILGRSLS